MVMDLDLCTLSTEYWVAISIGATLYGAAVGHALQFLCSKAGFGLSASPAQNFTGGCLFPVVASLLLGVGADRLIPDDPCGGAYTPDAVVVPLFVFLLASVSAIALFWIKAWRR